MIVLHDLLTKLGTFSPTTSLHKFLAFSKSSPSAILNIKIRNLLLVPYLFPRSVAYASSEKFSTILSILPFPLASSKPLGTLSHLYSTLYSHSIKVLNFPLGWSSSLFALQLLEPSFDGFFRETTLPFLYSLTSRYSSVKILTLFHELFHLSSLTSSSPLVKSDVPPLLYLGHSSNDLLSYLGVSPFSFVFSTIWDDMLSALSLFSVPLFYLPRFSFFSTLLDRLHFELSFSFPELEIKTLLPPFSSLSSINPSSSFTRSQEISEL